MADPPTKLETVERFLKVIREATLLAGLGFALYFLGPHIPSIASQLGTAQVDQLEFMGLQFKIQQAEATLQAAVKAEAPQEGQEDRQVGEQTKLIADALQTLSSATVPTSVSAAAPSDASPALDDRNSFWVYLGARRAGMWVTRYFDLEAVPTPDTSIRPTVDVFKRRSVPVVRQGEWVMGEAAGVLQTGTPVIVIRTASVPGTENRELWWAEVR